MSKYIPKISVFFNDAPLTGLFSVSALIEFIFDLIHTLKSEFWLFSSLILSLSCSSLKETVIKSKRISFKSIGARFSTSAANLDSGRDIRKVNLLCYWCSKMKKTSFIKHYYSTCILDCPLSE